MDYTAYIWIGATVVMVYFLLIRPQQTREKKDRVLRNSLEIGDRIVTIGGIVGRIINIKDDELTIETGPARHKMAMKKWCVQAKEDAVEEVKTEA